MKQFNNKGFTLVELIVVITILAILGTIAFISLQGYSKDSRDSVRISDVSNMKTSLELFHLNAGKYPLPDEYETVDYESEDLWHQGNFGEDVISSLSRNMSEVPTDPLTDKEYIFSVANNKNEFEILTLLESDLSLNNITQTNAASLKVTPKVDGTYNGLFIKTSTHIVPTPSIITSENIGVGVGLTLDNTNIKSQVVNAGKNIPDVGNVNNSTGELPGLELSVYTGSITKDDDNTKKEEIMLKIQAAYTSSELANDDIYEYILSLSGTDNLAGVLDTVVLGETTTTVVTTTTPPSFACGDTVSAGGETYTTILGPDGNCWTSQNMLHQPLAGASTSNWCYDDISTNCNSDGRLYSWRSVMGLPDGSLIETGNPFIETEDVSKSVCGQLGTGWVLPSTDDWTNLTTLGATGWIGNKLSGIISRMPGYRNSDNSGIYTSISTKGIRRASTGSSWDPEIDANFVRLLSSDDSVNLTLDDGKHWGFSVVCVKT